VNLISLWGPVVVLMAGIFTASAIPDIKDLPGGVSDKTGHLWAYAALGAALLRALAGGLLMPATPARSTAAVVAATSYGIALELYQWFVPGRSADRLDVVADAIGAVFGVVLFVVLRLVLLSLVRRRQNTNRGATTH
jgi:VanZ family protein